MSSELGLLEFKKKRVTGRPCVPCRNLKGMEPREGRECKTKKETVEYREATHLSAM